MCHGETVSLTKKVIVELDICDIFNSNTIESGDLGILEAAFVSAYNGLSLEYRDPYFWTLETALILKQGVFTPNGHLPVKIQVLTGKCCGCDPETIHIYDFLELGSSAGRRHHLRLQENRIPSTERLLDSMETCYCTSNAIADRVACHTGVYSVGVVHATIHPVLEVLEASVLHLY